MHAFECLDDSEAFRLSFRDQANPPTGILVSSRICKSWHWHPKRTSGPIPPPGESEGGER
jgi:hypothetical protein